MSSNDMHMTLKSRKTFGGNSLKKDTISENITCYLLIATQIIGFLVLTIYPIIWTFRWAFYYYNLTPSDTVFTGLDNFIKIFTNEPMYWQAWKNTILFAVVKICLELPLALCIAVVLSKLKQVGNFFRALYFLPHIISVAIIGLIFSNMFDYFGIINGFLMKLGIVETNINWFENRGTAMAIVILCSLWNTFGMNVLYFSAAVANVPEELYESARLEGAGAVTMFFKITLPMIAPVLQTVLLLSIVGSLQTNDLILVLTNGAPAGGTFTVNSYLTHNFAPGFFTGEIMPNIGYGSSLSLISAVILGFIAFGYSKLSARLQNIY
ncbi:MAG: sugar ABC transporter permease [Clostridia bacterium]|nr:sugar ABC transporter permease [Clostridia bacterium]